MEVEKEEGEDFAVEKESGENFAGASGAARDIHQLNPEFSCDFCDRLFQFNAGSWIRICHEEASPERYGEMGTVIKVDNVSDTLQYQPFQCMSRTRTVPLRWAVAIDGSKPLLQPAHKTKAMSWLSAKKVAKFKEYWQATGIGFEDKLITMNTELDFAETDAGL